MISLHALWGIESYQIMRVLGRIKKQPLVMLVDSGSTHNFIDHTVVKRLRCIPQLIPSINVTMANGETLRIQEVCKMVN